MVRFQIVMAFNTSLNKVCVLQKKRNLGRLYLLQVKSHRQTHDQTTIGVYTNTEPELHNSKACFVPSSTCPQDGLQMAAM